MKNYFACVNMKISERKNKVEIATAPDVYVAGLRNDDTGLRNDDKNKVEIAAAH